jgi:hypothetical protein
MLGGGVSAAGAIDSVGGGDPTRDCAESNVYLASNSSIGVSERGGEATFNLTESGNVSGEDVRLIALSSRSCSAMAGFSAELVSFERLVAAVDAELLTGDKARPKTFS